MSARERCRLLQQLKQKLYEHDDDGDSRRERYLGGIVYTIVGYILSFGIYQCLVYTLINANNRRILDDYLTTI